MNQKETLEYYKLQAHVFTRLYEETIYRSKQSLNTYKEVRDHRKNGSFEFIPLQASELFHTFTMVRNLYNYPRASFLDAGCGIGNALQIAMAVGLGNYYAGLELFDKTYKAAKSNLRHGVKLLKQDILTYTEYGEYDFIYFYCPFTDPEKQKQFEERVEDQMKVGAVLIPYLKRSQRIVKDKRFKRKRFHGPFSWATIYEKTKE